MTSVNLPVLPTLSQLPRALECPAAYLLPQCHTIPGKPADQGTAMHDFLANITTMGAEAALAAVPEQFQDVCDAINVQKLPVEAPGVQHEVAVAYNPDTDVGRIIGVNLRGAYRDLQWCSANGVDRTRELVGALDTVQLDVTGIAFSWEWKGGWGAKSNVARAEKNWQVLPGGLGYARAMGASSLEAWVVRISETGWVDDTDHVALDALELFDLAGRVQKKVAEYRRTAELVDSGGTPDVFEGPWCTYCRAFNACPAKTALIVKAVTAPLTLEQEVHALLTQPQNREKAYRLWRLFDDLAGKLGEQVCGTAVQNPIALGNGNVFGQHQVEKKVLDGDKVFQLLQNDSRYGMDLALQAVEMKTSQAAIKAAAKAAGQKQAPELRRILSQLESSGGLTRKMVTKLEEFDPAKELSAAANSDAEVA